MIAKPKILFVADKWCSGNPDWGLSAWEGNLWQSLKSLDLAEVEVFHFDEYYRVNGTKGDQALLNKVVEFQPEIIYLVIYNLPDTVNTPALKTLEQIKESSSAKIFAIWGDTQSEKLIKISDIVEPFIDFNMFTASAVVFRRWQGIKKDTRKFSYFWVPKDPQYFCDPGRLRDLDLSFLGGINPSRLQRIKYLEEHGIKIQYGGGERKDNLSVTEYSGTFQRSKIVLNFSRSSHIPLITARAFEVTNCAALLLEEAGPETIKLFLPYVDYVPYFSNKDLLNKTRYYLENETERAKIANSGYLKTQIYYSALRFWKLVLAKAKETSPAVFNKAQSYQLDQASDQLILANWGKKTIELPWSRLKKLTFFQAVTLKGADWFCSYKLSYFFYLCFQRLKDWRWLVFKCSYACFKAARWVLPERLSNRLKEGLKPCAGRMVREITCGYKDCGLSSWIMDANKKEDKIIQ